MYLKKKWIHFVKYKVKILRKTWEEWNRLWIILTIFIITLVFGFDIIFKELKCFLSREEIVYHRGMPLIFISEVFSSGSGLLLDLLDSHPDIRCIQTIPSVYYLYNLTHKNSIHHKEKIRLAEAGVTRKVLGSANAAFFLEQFALSGEAAPRLCYNDPITMKGAMYFNFLFPRAKFILLVRDGRGMVHDLLHKTNATYNDYANRLMEWNTESSHLVVNCVRLGEMKCMIVRFEQLVLQTAAVLEEVLHFLHVPWSKEVFREDNLRFVTDNTGDIKNLSDWLGRIPNEVDIFAPALGILGYDLRMANYDKMTPVRLSEIDISDIMKDEFSLLFKDDI
uniref:Protein-tyrosine sulfotransferase n=1 Tax=Clastoptera arizonana TaxID=38151 RepID=A0A1B6E813_9HEMI